MSFISTNWPPPHIAAIGLQQERFLAAPSGKADAIVEDPPVAAVCRVPGHIAGARPLREFAVMGREIAIVIDGGAKSDPIVALDGFLLDGRECRIGKLCKGRHVLHRVGSGNRLIAAIKKRAQICPARGNAGFEGARRFCGKRHHGLDIGCICGFDPGTRGRLDHALRNRHDVTNPASGFLQPVIGFEDRAGSRSDCGGEFRALAVDGFRCRGERRGIVEDLRHHILYLDERPLHSDSCRFHILCRARCTLAGDQQAVDPAVEPCKRSLDGNGGLGCL